MGGAASALGRSSRANSLTSVYDGETDEEAEAVDMQLGIQEDNLVHTCEVCMDCAEEHGSIQC